jgi:hypothetical protein
MDVDEQEGIFVVCFMTKWQLFFFLFLFSFFYLQGLVDYR